MLRKLNIESLPKFINKGTITLHDINTNEINK